MWFCCWLGVWLFLWCYGFEGFEVIDDGECFWVSGICEFVIVCVFNVNVKCNGLCLWLVVFMLVVVFDVVGNCFVYDWLKDVVDFDYCCVVLYSG